jgi:hypothetical protein
MILMAWYAKAGCGCLVPYSTVRHRLHNRKEVVYARFPRAPIDMPAFYPHRPYILPNYQYRPHFVQFTRTALLTYLRLGQVATENA